MRTFVYCSLLWSLLFCGMSSWIFGQSDEYAPGQVLIKFKADKTVAQKNTLKDAMNAQSLKTYPEGIELWKIKSPQNSIDIKALVSQYRNHPDIEFVEPNYIVSLGSTVPNDPSFGSLWGLNNIGQSGGTQDADIDAPEAWDIATGSPSVVVAIIDTGIDWGHPDLVNNIWQNLGEDADGDGKVIEWNGSRWVFDPGDINNIDDDGNGYKDDFVGWDFRNNDNNPYDDHFHGTHVAGTVGAEGDNRGVVGVTWDVQLAALKFLSASGSGYISDALEALNYCVAMDIPISNNSWGGGGYSTPFYEALQSAKSNGHLFVAAAGNSNKNADSYPMYPAAYNVNNVISVAATTRTDSRSSFSNYGATTVDLGAPGSDIYSCMPNNGYASKNGTSMASPHVAGACALLWGLCPTKTYAQIKSDIMSSTDPIPALTGKTVSGGRLNVHKALLICNPAPPTPTCRYNDSLALVTLYNATNGANWTNPWNLNQPMTTWHGVTLNTDGCLSVLDLNSNNLTGSIPTDIGELQDCVYLNLSLNQLSGTIPNTIGNLQNLGFLNLRTNQLSGAIPMEIGNLQGITFLALNNNQLTGSIPPEMAGMQSLGLLYLNNNQLSGCYAPVLSALCTQLYNSANSNISNGNNFNAAWESFCNSQAGNCNGPVWPGDANADGQVDEDDYPIWAVARASASMGPSRPNASNSWSAQPCPDWQQAFEGINGKHQDCNGDGAADEQDDDIIASNFGKTIGTSSLDYIASTLNYRLVPLPPISGFLAYELHVEDEQGNPVIVHGISCSLNISNDISVGNIFMDTAGSSLVPDETYEHYNTEENRLSVALTRTDGVNQLCNGAVAKFIIVTTDLPDGDPFTFDVDGGTTVEANGSTESVAGMTVHDIYTGTQPNSNQPVRWNAPLHLHVEYRSNYKHYFELDSRLVRSYGHRC